MKTFRKALFFFVFFSFFADSFAQNPSKKIRVPRFADDALYSFSGNDKNSSYASEFLENLNRYTDYEFVFVDMDRKDIIKKLNDGVIDLIPFMGTEGDPLHEVLFSSIPSAIGSTVLASNRICDMERLRIGILTHAPKSLKEKIFRYAESQEIDATYFYYDTDTDLFADLYAGNIDVFATIDLAIPPDFTVLATIENTFFYFAVSPRNSDLYKVLDDSLSTYFLLNPSFLSSLRSKYVHSARYSVNAFSPKEEKYVRKHKTLRIAALENQPPYCSFVKGEFHGIIIDQISEIARASGLSVVYEKASSYLAAVEMVKAGKADALYAVSDLLTKSDLDYIKPTSPLLSQKFVCLCQNEKLLEKNAVFVEIRGVQYAKDYLDRNYKVTDVVSVDTSEACVDLIRKNENYFTLLPSSEADYYKNKNILRPLSVSKMGYYTSISLGLSRTSKPELASVLDKSIFKLTSSMFENFMEKNEVFFNQAVKRQRFWLKLLLGVAVSSLLIAIFLFAILETRRRKDKQIKYAMNLANRDSMTGLFNHIAFEKKVSGILAHQEENEIGVFVMIDIDDFKKVNDTLGHAKGDYVIVSVANILISTFRSGDLKGRLGGDEFAVFMKAVSDMEAVKHKMRILQIAIKEYFEKNSLGINVTCSIGISWCKGKPENASFLKIYKAADEGLYKVKKSGKNAFSIVNMNAVPDE
ncbi:MAG: diguanylate cyclase, partial [Treponema sp.]|nr:diguanylate cyclase [Treponema sp.]